MLKSLFTLFFFSIALIYAEQNIELMQIDDLVTDKSMSEITIEQIYKNYILIHDNPKYLSRYNPLPMKKNTKHWPWSGKDFPRVIALLEFERFVQNHNLESSKALIFNGQTDPELLYLPTHHIDYIDYDGTDKTDLHQVDLGIYDYDFMMANQTLEHVWNPAICFDTFYKHLKKGGILYLNVPVINMAHSTPFHHYTGITPVGLGMLAIASGFKILEIGQFGNTEYLTQLFRKKIWPTFRDLKKPGVNEFDSPVTTWIFAIKM